MTISGINIKEELLFGIKSKMSDITCNQRGMPVYLADVSFKAAGMRGGNDRISISCLFINEDGRVCADMFRSGSAGCVDFICGLMIDSFEESVLVHLITCLNRNMWHIHDSIDELRKKKKGISSHLKISLFKKGA
jgi:hypothetical protein